MLNIFLGSTKCNAIVIFMLSQTKKFGNVCLSIDTLWFLVYHRTTCWTLSSQVFTTTSDIAPLETFVSLVKFPSIMPTTTARLHSEGILVFYVPSSLAYFRAQSLAHSCSAVYIFSWSNNHTYVSPTAKQTVFGWTFLSSLSDRLKNFYMTGLPLQMHVVSPLEDRSVCFSCLGNIIYKISPLLFVELQQN